MTSQPRRRPRSAVRLAVALTTAVVAVVAAAPAVAAPAPPAVVRLPDGLQPEGVTSYGTTFWVGSLADGRILVGDVRTPGTDTVLLPGATGRQLRGLAFDPRSNLLWAVGNVGSVGHVYAVNAFSGLVVRDVVVPGAMFLNDLYVAADAVWVTDSLVDRLTRIAVDDRGRPTGADPAFLPLTGAWTGAPAGENAANGIVPVDARRALVVNSFSGGLFSVDLTSGAATVVRVTGGTLTGGDGLERRGATLWVVRGVDDVSVSQLALSTGPVQVAASYVTTLTDPTLDVPSTATLAAGALYAVNARFGTPSPSTAAYYLTRLPVTLSR